MVDGVGSLGLRRMSLKIRPKRVAKLEAERKQQNSSLLDKARDKRDLYKDFDLVVSGSPTTTFLEDEFAGDYLKIKKRIYYPETQIPVKSNKSQLLTLAFFGNPAVEKGDKIRACIFLGEKQDLEPDCYIGGMSWGYSPEFLEILRREKSCARYERIHQEHKERWFVYTPREVSERETAEIIHKLRDGKIVRTWHRISKLDEQVS